jgi:hypothetical protein
MDIINRKKALVEEFSPMLEKYSKLTKLWIAFLVAVIISRYGSFCASSGIRT